MALTDIFTGAPQANASAQQRGIFQFVDARNRGDINNALNTSTGYVQGGNAAGRADLGFGYGAGTDAINSGFGDAINYLNTSGTSLAGLRDKYGAGTNLYLDSLGVNGPEGNTRATGAFQASPGYDFALNQGIEAINRSRNARGMLNSGNTDRDALTYGQGLANQEYGNWRSSLGGLVNPELNAAGLEGVNSRALATTAGNRGQMLSDLASRYGTGMAGLDTGEGNTLAGLTTNAANANVAGALNLAQPYGKTYSDAANAAMAGSGNIWNLALQGAKLAAGAAGGGGFGGGGVDPIASTGGVRWV